MSAEARFKMVVVEGPRKGGESATLDQVAVLRALRRLGAGTRPIRPHHLLPPYTSSENFMMPSTEAAARAALERLSRQGLVKRLPGRPAFYLLSGGSNDR